MRLVLVSIPIGTDTRSEPPRGRGVKWSSGRASKRLRLIRRPRRRHARVLTLRIHPRLSRSAHLARRCGGRRAGMVFRGEAERSAGRRVPKAPRNTMPVRRPHLSFDDRREQALFLERRRQEGRVTCGSHPKTTAQSGGGVGILQKKFAGGAGVAPHAHPKPERTEGGAAGDTSACARATKERWQRRTRRPAPTQRREWPRRAFPVRGTSRESEERGPATALRTSNAGALAGCLRGRS